MCLTLERSGDFARLVLDSPPRNEMNRAFFERLARLVREELPGLRVRGLVVCGRGRHFSSGADLKELMAGIRRDHAAWDGAWLREASLSIHALSELPYPVAAAIRGCCLGSGLELALACRYRVAAAGSVFALPETSFGLMPGCGGTLRLPRCVGQGTAVRMILTGETVGAEDALAMGLVDSLASRADVEAEAERLIGMAS